MISPVPPRLHLVTAPILAAALGIGCSSEPPPPPATSAVAPAVPLPPVEPVLSLPGSRVSLSLPLPAERIGRGHRHRLHRAGLVEIRVAELTAAPGEPIPFDVLRGSAGVDPGTELHEDPPGSGVWKTDPKLPRYAAVRQLQVDRAAAVVLVGTDVPADREFADRVLASATLDPSRDYDPSRLLGVTVDPPPGSTVRAIAGPGLQFVPADPTIDGGLTVVWINGGIAIDDAALLANLKGVVRERAGLPDAEPVVVDHGGLHGYRASGSYPPTGAFEIATLAVPGETDGLLMVYASVRGRGTDAIMPDLVASARSVRLTSP